MSPFNLFFWTFLLLIFGLIARPIFKSKANYSSFSKREIPKKTLNNYHLNKDFNYEEIEAPINIWDSFVLWLGSFYLGGLGNVLSSSLSYWILGFTGALFFVFVLYKTGGLNNLKLFQKIDKNLLIPDFQNNNDKGLNLDLLIKENISNGNYQEAIRYWYYKSLVFLDKNGEIKLSASKSNLNYLNELNGTFLYKPFSTLTYFFDYSFYGGFPVNESQFYEIQNLFLKFLDSKRA